MVKGFQEKFKACPFIEVGQPVLEKIRKYNRNILAKFNVSSGGGSLLTARGELDLYTERYLETYVKVRLNE